MHTEPIVSEGMNPHAGAWGLEYLVSVGKAIQYFELANLTFIQ